MKNLLFPILFLMCSLQVSAQKYFSRNTHTEFLSTTPVEVINGKNDQVSALFDEVSGNIAFQVPIRGFKFKQALLEEHFNENYMESVTYPKSTYAGTISNWSLDLKDGEVHDVVSTGELTIHGVTLEKSANGTIQFSDGDWILNASFQVNPEDYEIEIPKIVRDKISNNLEITVHSNLIPK